jgi:DNA-binding Lrp family transcriptional regulator
LSLRAPALRKAFVLVNSGLGTETDLQSELKKIEGITGVYEVYGVYDLIAEVEAESEQKLKYIIFSRIRALEGVRSTLTLTVV